MGLRNSLCEDSWILRIEEKVDSGQFDVLSLFFVLSVPVAGIDLTFVIVGVNEHWAPMSNSIDQVEAFSWNRLE